MIRTFLHADATVVWPLCSGDHPEMKVIREAVDAGIWAALTPSAAKLLIALMVRSHSRPVTAAHLDDAGQTGLTPFQLGMAVEELKQRGLVRISRPVRAARVARPVATAA